MNTNKTTKLALLGMLGALAVNMSIWWGSHYSGSESMASRQRDSLSDQKHLERCVRNAMNAPRLNEQLFECKLERDGNEIVVSGKLELTEREVRSNSPNNGRQTLNDIVDNGETDNESGATAAKIPTYALHLTAATNSECDEDCFRTSINETYYSDRDGRLRKDFDIEVGSQGGMANDTLAKINDILSLIDEQNADHREERRDQKKRDLRYAMCTHDQNGDRIQPGDEAFDDCVDTQLAELSGNELKKFVNRRLFPYASQLMHEDPEKYEEYLDMLGSHIDCEDTEKLKHCKGTNSQFLAGTLLNLKSFNQDWTRRQRLLRQFNQQLQRDAMFLPADQRAAFISSHLSNFENQYIQNHVDPRLNNELLRAPLFADQYAIIQDTLRTGRPPQSLGGYSTYSNVSTSFGSSNFGSSFSEDTARASIEALYPEYSRQRSHVPSVGVSIDNSATRIRSSLSTTNDNRRSTINNGSRRGRI